MSFNPFEKLFSFAGSKTSYEKLWQQLKKNQEDDLPKSVLENANTIYQKARKDDNFPQLLKSWIYIIQTRSNLDPENFSIDTLEPLPHKGAVQTALYNAVMGSAYMVMTDTSISERDQETQRDYKATADSLFAAALSDREALYAESALDYMPLIEKGKDSRLFRHNLLAVVARFVMDRSRMDGLQKADLAGQLASFYREKGNLEAYTLMRLAQMDYMRHLYDYNILMKLDTYKAELLKLMEESKQLEAYADVAEAYARLLNEDDKADFCRQFLDKHSHAYNAPYFKGSLQNYLHPDLHTSFSDNILVNQPFTFSLAYENITSATLTIRAFVGYKDKEKREPRLNGDILQKHTYTLGDDARNTERRLKGYSTDGRLDTTLTLPAGRYVFITEAIGEKEVSVVKLSSLRLLSFRLPDKRVMAIVYDNETGRPVPNAIVTMSSRNDDVIATEQCNDQGEAFFAYNDALRYIKASIPGTDDETDNSYLGTDSKGDTQRNHSVTLFTDRAIYRPGQTVHVSGIAYSQEGDRTWVEAEHIVELSLRNANYRVIATQNVLTNALGSFDADFELPKDEMPGQFRIECNNTRCFFRMEEYKRPTFEVEVKNSATDGRLFTFGETIQVEALAKSYAGVPVQDAKVKYKVETSQVEFWRWWDTSWRTISEADTLTDDRGIALIPLYLDPTALSEWSSAMVRYRVTCTVTDQAGETRSGSYQFSMSRRKFSLRIELPSVIDVADGQAQFTVKAINVNHEPVSCEGTYVIYQDNIDKPLHTGRFVANQPVNLPSLADGYYHVRALAQETDEREVADASTFSLYDSRHALDLRQVNARQQATAASTTFDSDLVHVSRGTFNEDRPAEIIFSPIKDDIVLGYFITSNSEVIDHRRLTMGRQLYRLLIPYEQRFGDGVSVTFYYVRDGHVLQERKTLEYVYPEKHLKLSWSTFRDRLYPGQDEEWILSITGPDGKPVQKAELLATMYDASLEQLAKHDWHFGLTFSRNIYSFAKHISSRNMIHGESIRGKYGDTNYDERKYDELTEYIHDRWSLSSMLRKKFNDFSDGASLRMAGGARPMYSRMAMEVAMSEPQMVMAEEANDNTVAFNAEPSSPETDEPQVELRANFAETAFFYPHLMTDQDGLVRISFTLPESLTEWRFLGLAHDGDVNYGQITANAVARKDFMVQPNMPRFVREGDKASISVRVINQCESVIEGKVRMRLLDAETERVVFTDEQPVSVEVGKSTAVTFGFKVDERYPMLICEAVGIAGNTSDGERNLLPVLSSRQYVTEAVPFYAMATDETVQVDLTHLFNGNSPTATQRRLLLEYTQHPEWTVIEALEGIKLPEYDNVTSYAASLYANTMASQLAQRIPGFKLALLRAKEAGQAPQSQLDLNDDLRDIIQKSSPWLAEALNEAEQRARLIDLFDSKLMGERIQKAKDRLKKLQKSDGAWSWFEGMSSSYYITLSTCESLIGLYHLDPEVAQMVDAAMAYLDSKELQFYKARKKEKLSTIADSNTMLYLFIWSMIPDRQVSKEVSKMRDDQLDVIAKSVRDLTILGRSQAACTLRSFGHVKEADKFVQSAVEYTVTQPGMGRFYATDAAYYSWRDYRIPSQLAAMRAIKASSRPDKQQLINEMQTWLLRQKQTQTWDNPMNTISAAQFLLEDLSFGSDTSVLPSFAIDGKPLSVSIDSTRFLAEQLGYVRTQLPDEVFHHGVASLSVTQPAIQPAEAEASPIAWGAVYAQFMEQLDQIKQYTSGQISIDVRLLDETGMHVLDPASTVLRVGDRVTMRIVVKADRDMDFVQVRCPRPACFEPVSQRSGYMWMDGQGGYVALHDSSADVFFDTFRRGTTTFDLKYNVDRLGQYTSGVATVQCAYAPEFGAHGKALTVTVK